ncbi:hypothetical protein PVAND_006489 [Polypedilum vanderplanki]|uniref:Neurotransmitter-gated ion-channel ligand-binding domain-containing protein n=1 Tax=Polypedilum vanderplanki TaxID=319348 RepID=A0A9J6C3T1_POLVA|nr:hypothetical protein PVAND_006489 [Polypedilum vanderplanki]
MKLISVHNSTSMMKLHLILVLVILIEFSESLDCSDRESTQTPLKLRKRILCDYDKAIAPVRNGPIAITFDFIFKKFKFVQTTRTMEIKSYVILSWKDERLAWNPNDFDGIELSFAPFDLLWVPDISIFESDVIEDLNSCIATYCKLYSNGNVSCIMPCEQKIYCSEANYKNWPFDNAKCSFTYASATKNINKIIFVSQSLRIDSEGGAQSRSWELISSQIFISNETNSLKIYGPDNSFYSTINLSFIIERHSKELIHQVLIPAIIMIVSNLFILFLDAEMIERWILYAIMLFSHYMYNVQLNWLLPSSDSVPNIYTFFCDSQIITTLLMLYSMIFKILIEDDDDERVWLRKVMVFLDKSLIGKFVINQEKDVICNESPKSVDEAFRKPAVMRNFCRFIDRILITVLIMLYVFMFYILMPKDRENTNPYGLIFESDY